MRMTEALDSFIRRVRWKAWMFDRKSEVITENKTGDYGFKTDRTPPSNEHLLAFENDLYYALIKSIEYKKTENKFLHQVKSDVKKITRSKSIYVFADKTTNLYEVDSNTYNKVLRENISKTYKKVSSEVTAAINCEAKSIVNDLKLGNKVDCYAKKNAYITLKDHKENFKNNLPCRLINPAKSEIGIISRHILQQHNEVIRNVTGLQQWRETTSVIDWFKAIDNKNKCRFLKFDIEKYYPSITKDILQRSLDFAKQYTSITPQEIDIILHARKTVLFDRHETWKKSHLMICLMSPWEAMTVQK